MFLYKMGAEVGIVNSYITSALCRCKMELQYVSYLEYHKGTVVSRSSGGNKLMLRRKVGVLQRKNRESPVKTNAQTICFS